MPSEPPNTPRAPVRRPAVGFVSSAGSYLPLVLVLASGIGLSLIAFSAVRVWEQHMAVEMSSVNFENAARERIVAVRRELEQGLDALADLVAFMRVTGSPAALPPYSVHVLARRPVVQMLGWVPFVAPGEQPSDSTGKLAPDLVVTVRDASGRFVPSDQVGERYPLIPLTSYSELLPEAGFDLGSEPLFLDALVRARDEGGPVMTARLPQSGPQWPGYDVAAVAPVYRFGGVPATVTERRKLIQGFVMAGYRLDKMVARATAGGRSTEVELWVFDETRKPTETALYQPYPVRTGKRPPEDPRSHRRAIVESVPVGERVWSVVAIPSATGERQPQTFSRWLVLAGGLTITALLVWYMLALRRQARELVAANAAIGREIEEHRRTEAALRASESRFRKILESAGDAILIVDSAGRVAVANRRAEEMFGYSADKLKGMPVSALVPDADRAAHRQHERSYIDNPERHAMGPGRELAARHKDGRTIPVEINLSPLRTPEGLFITAIIRDVTERRQVEQRVRWLASFPAENPNPVLRVRSDGQIVYANESSAGLLELWGCVAGDTVPEPYLGTALGALRDGRQHNREVAFGGRIHVLNFAPSEEHVNIYGLDITDRREAEHTRERLSAILEATTDFAGVAEAESNRIVYINAAGRRMLGIASDDELLSLRIPELLTPESRELVETEAMPQAVKHGSWNGEMSFASRDGNRFPVSVVILAHRDAAGRIEYFSCIARDFSQVKRAEARLQRLNRTHAVLSECNQALVRAASETELLRAFCHNLVEVGGYPFAWVGFTDEKERVIHPVAHAGSGGDYLKVAPIPWDTGAGREGPVGRAVRERRVVIDHDLGSSERVEPWHGEVLRRGFRSVVALPLSRDDDIFGVLAIYATEADVFDAKEEALLKELADDLAFGVHSLWVRDAHQEVESDLLIRNRALEISRNGVMICDARRDDLPLIYVNSAFEHITGYSPEEVLGSNPGFLHKADPDQPELEKIAAALRHRVEGKAVLRNYRKDGSLFWNELFVAPVYGEGGELTHYVGIINDITEYKRYEEELEYQAQHDELTGLPNRNLMQDRLDQVLVYAERHQRTVAVLFLDLDQFKVINDGLGHRVGDEMLKVVAARLVDCAGEGDTVARYGGDEFVIVLPDLERLEEVNIVAERMLEAVTETIEVDGHKLQTTASIGATLFPRDGRDSVTLIKNADAAMYRTKELGRNNIHFYTEDLNSRLMERLTLERQLRRAIDDGELLLHYQPQVDLQSGAIVGFEALVRWQHPELGMVSPGRFIPIAEETGLIVPLGEWVLATACEQNRAWQAAGLPPVCVSVNLSARQLARDDLFDNIRQALSESGLAAEYLELELTESSVMSDPQEMLARLRRLKDLGVRISIDDFGTGYSSLSQLKRFPFDRLKIDQSFVRDITSDPDDAAIAMTIIGMAQTLKLRVIAEGVESQGQLRYLMRQGCDEVQGFFFSRPLPAGEAEKLLREAPVFALPSSESADPRQVLLLAAEPRAERLAESLGDDFHLLVAHDCDTAFDLLAEHDVRAVVADEQVGEMSGGEFLTRVGELYRHSIRLLVSERGTADTGGADRLLVHPSPAALRDAISDLLRSAA